MKLHVHLILDWQAHFIALLMNQMEVSRLLCVKFSCESFMFDYFKAFAKAI